MVTARLAVPLLAVLMTAAGCRVNEGTQPATRDPEGVLTDLALTDGERVCETPEGDLLAWGLIVAHADGNMHRVAECANPQRPLYVHERHVDVAPEQQEFYVRVAENRYLRVRPPAGEG